MSLESEMLGDESAPDRTQPQAILGRSAPPLSKARLEWDFLLTRPPGPRPPRPSVGGRFTKGQAGTLVLPRHIFVTA